MKAKVIESKRLVLKPLSLQHLSQDYIDWLNDEEVYKYLQTGGNYTQKMLNEYLAEVENKDIFFWAIHIKENGLHIGNVKIDPINWQHSRAEYGIMMGRKSEWGKGYATEATLKVIGFCFLKLNIRKLTLGAITDNVDAINLYKKIGFETEGIFKKHGLHQGKYYCDVIRMALFNPSYSKIL